MELYSQTRITGYLIHDPYQCAEGFLGEKVLTLRAHNAADIQTGALGDVEITLIADDDIIISYKMKNKRVTREDIDRALQNLLLSSRRVNNYIFITTEPVGEEVQDYARSLYHEIRAYPKTKNPISESVALPEIGFLVFIAE